MKCKNCKYRKNIGNTSETGSAICSYSSSWFPVNIENNCHLISEKKELKCGDCSRLGEDTACFDCSEDDSAIYNDNCAEDLWMNGKKNLNKYLCFGKFKDFMTVKKCLWHTACVENGCEELCPLFCDVDDITYGGLKKIGFKRTKTLGYGGDCCDFHFYKK